ncbi:hypothetical protein C8R45DRAFT_939509 [Mycena sanguinolenta]|nr:hypothetical protein C8R45DRAFT_939509 [Mycena sanguinolenta]
MSRTMWMIWLWHGGSETSSSSWDEGSYEVSVYELLPRADGEIAFHGSRESTRGNQSQIEVPIERQNATTYYMLAVGYFERRRSDCLHAARGTITDGGGLYVD